MPFNDNDLESVCNQLNNKLELFLPCQFDQKNKTITIVLDIQYLAENYPFSFYDTCDFGVSLFKAMTGGATVDWNLLVYRYEDRFKLRVCKLS